MINHQKNGKISNENINDNKNHQRHQHHRYHRRLSDEQLNKLKTNRKNIIISPNISSFEKVKSILKGNNSKLSVIKEADNNKIITTNGLLSKRNHRCQSFDKIYLIKPGDEHYRYIETHLEKSKSFEKFLKNVLKGKERSKDRMSLVNNNNHFNDLKSKRNSNNTLIKKMIQNDNIDEGEDKNFKFDDFNLNKNKEMNNADDDHSTLKSVNLNETSLNDDSTAFIPDNIKYALSAAGINIEQITQMKNELENSFNTKHNIKNNNEKDVSSSIIETSSSSVGSLLKRPIPTSTDTNNNNNKNKKLFNLTTTTTTTGDNTKINSNNQESKCRKTSVSQIEKKPNSITRTITTTTKRSSGPLVINETVDDKKDLKFKKKLSTESSTESVESSASSLSPPPPPPSIKLSSSNNNNDHLIDKADNEIDSTLSQLRNFQVNQRLLRVDFQIGFLIRNHFVSDR
jgi:hypothetical protein